MQTKIATVPAGTNAQGVSGTPASIETYSPTGVWRGAMAARRELTDQRNSLQGTRRGIAEQLRNPMVEGADRQGLERQVIAVDGQIAALDKEIAAANSRVAATALVPGAVVEPTYHRDGPPDAVYILSALFMVVVLLPLSVAAAVRYLRRGAARMTALPQELIERFSRLDQAVDAMAVEIERIGEGQRFVTRVLAEKAPAALSSDKRASSGS